jgi:hypothetical protein
VSYIYAQINPCRLGDRICWGLWRIMCSLTLGAIIEGSQHHVDWGWRSNSNKWKRHENHFSLSLFLIFNFIFWCYGVWTQGLTLAVQVLYHLSHTPSPQNYLLYDYLEPLSETMGTLGGPGEGQLLLFLRQTKWGLVSFLLPGVHFSGNTNGLLPVCLQVLFKWHLIKFSWPPSEIVPLWDGGVAQVVQCLLNKHEALNSTPPVLI